MELIAGAVRSDSYVRWLIRLALDLSTSDVLAERGAGDREIAGLF